MIMDALTSAAGPMLERTRPLPICVSGTASIQGTMSIPLLPSIAWECLLVRTNSGFSVAENYYPSSSTAIMELRRISGFTWEQLTRLFSVTRRSLHFWASGKPLSAANEEHLQHLLATVRSVDRGDASENRSLLLSALPDGTIPFDLLVAKEYDDVLRRLGAGTVRARPIVTVLSSHARTFRTPRRPHELVGALQDSIHVQKGRLLSATPIRTKGRK